MKNLTKQSTLGLCMVVLLAILPDSAPGQTVDLGTAANFAVLAGAGIANTGATTLTGDVGSYLTTTITGFETVTLSGTNHGGDSTTQGAKLDLLLAYVDALGRLPTMIYGPIFDLGGLTLAPGVYNDPSSFGITGTLTLDAIGDPNAVWIFQSGSTLTTASNSAVVLVNGAMATNVFWQVGSSATIGTDTDFAGTILALTSITVNPGAEVNGGLLAINGAVTLDNNVVSVPEPGSFLLLGLGLALLCSRRRTLPT